RASHDPCGGALAGERDPGRLGIEASLSVLDGSRLQGKSGPRLFLIERADLDAPRRGNVNSRSATNCYEVPPFGAKCGARRRSKVAAAARGEAKGSSNEEEAAGLRR